MSPPRCAQVRDLLSAYLDGELSPQARVLVRDHLATCAACSSELETLQETSALVGRLPKAELPPAFHATLVQKVKAEAAARPVAARSGADRVSGAGLSRPGFTLPRFGRPVYRWAAIAAAFVVLVVWAGGFAYFMGVPVPGYRLLGLGKGPNLTEPTHGQPGGFAPDIGRVGAPQGGQGGATESGSTGSLAFTDKTGSAPPGTEGGTGAGGLGSSVLSALGNQPAVGRKVVVNYYLTLNCEDVVAAKSRAVSITEAAGGYIEALNFWTDQNGVTNASMTLRVPVNVLSGVIDELSSLGKVANEQIAAQDVTAQYVDVSARVKALREQEQRLLELLGRAQSLSDILVLENELARVRTEIEQYESMVRSLDQQTTYSTVHLTLQPPGAGPVPKPGNLWGRITDAFLKSIRWLGRLAEGTLVFLAGLLPVAAVLALVGWLVYRGMKARRQRMGV